MDGHGVRKHARLSPSGAARWLECTASPEVEDAFESTTSEYAEEGTAAHELSEELLKVRLGYATQEQFNTWFYQWPKREKYYSVDMYDHCMSYIEQVLEIINEHVAATGQMPFVLLEERYDLRAYVPESSGSSDVTILSWFRLDTIDLKYGQGVAVSAVENYQTRLYCLGAYLRFYGEYQFPNVCSTIIQPRLNSVSREELSTYVLYEWAESFVKPRALEAHAQGGVYRPSEKSCKWCKGKATCRARADYMLELCKYEFTNPILMSVPEIAEVLAKAAQLSSWASEVQRYALDEALDGVKFPGWKLVRGSARRKVTDTDGLAKQLKAHGGITDSQIYKTPELKSLTELEKQFGKKRFTEMSWGYITKPPGSLTLALESDLRPEANTIEAAKADFKEDYNYG